MCAECIQVYGYPAIQMSVTWCGVISNLRTCCLSATDQLSYFSFFESVKNVNVFSNMSSVRPAL